MPAFSNLPGLVRRNNRDSTGVQEGLPFLGIRVTKLLLLDLVKMSRVQFSDVLLILVEGLPFEEKALIVLFVDNKDSLARVGSIVDILVLHLFFTADVPYRLKFQF